MIDNLDCRSTAELAALHRELAGQSQRIAEILAIRASGADGAVPVAFQLNLLPPTEPIDPESIDMSEIRANGRPRYVKRKDAAFELGCGVDKIKDLILETGAGFQFGATWYVDMTRIVATVKV